MTRAQLKERVPPRTLAREGKAQPISDNFSPAGTISIAAEVRTDRRLVDDLSRPLLRSDGLPCILVVPQADPDADSSLITAEGSLANLPTKTIS